MPHPLRPKNRKGEGHSKDEKYFTWDIETANWTRFLICGLYDGSSFRTFTRLQDFLEYVLTHLDGWIGYAHFGGRFDHLFLIDAYLRYFELPQSKLRKNHDRLIWQLHTMIPRGSGVYSLTIERDGSKVKFFDSSAILPFGLRRLTENFKVEHPKKEIDYTQITKVTPELIEYLEFDCKGLYECIQKFQTWPVIKKAGPAKSLASQSLKVLQTFLQHPIYGFTEKLDRDIRPAYFGGRTEIFRLLYNSKGKTRLKCYDVNSLYPFVMRDNDFPNEFLGMSYEYDPKSLGIWHCEVHIPKGCYIPPLGIVYRSKFVFPTGTFNAFITSAEVEYVRSLGFTVKPKSGYLFSNGGRFFKQFVNTLYAIREKSKRDSVDNTISKLLLNSCYGRFGLRFDREEYVFDKGQLGVKLPLNDIEFNIDGETYRLAIQDKKYEGFSNVAIATFVTAYARIHMHRLLTSCGEDLYYTDTDSIFTTRDLPTGNGLGELKFEYECSSAVFLLPKTYAVSQGKKGEKEVVMKGFDKKKIRDFTLDDFEACLKGDLGRLQIKEEPKFQTFKRALRSGELISMSKGGLRQLRSQYDKRRVLSDYNTRAIHIRGNQ